MSTGVTIDAAGLAARLRDQAARRLLAVALTFQAEARKDLSRGNPAPHRNPAPRGEFPRLRTGQGRAAVSLETADRRRIAAEGRVRVGLTPAGEHLAVLRRRGWKGLGDTLARCRAQLAAIQAGGAA